MPKKKKKTKPDKPRADFPLGAAANGQWCKKVKGKIHYFGVWANPEAAEAEYLRVKEYLQAGRLPPVAAADAVRLSDLCNRFLNAKKALLATSELSVRTFTSYHAACAGILDHFGKERLVSDCGPDDFAAFRVKLSKSWGLHGLAKWVTITKMVFGFAYDNELIDKPIRFGDAFSRPTKKSMRLHRARKQNEHGLRMLEAAEIRQLLAHANVPLRAMILLACNGALGNTDIASLPQSAVQGPWLQFARVKTGVDRRIPLWPETQQALQLAIEQRPKPKKPEHVGLCFITTRGAPWVRTGPNGRSVHDLVSNSFSRLLTAQNLKRNGLGFYALRHTFETVSGGCGDQVATSAVMGHVDSSMAANYRERIDDDRLLAVVNHVRSWLFDVPAKGGKQ